ncbi:MULTISPECIES: Eco57I restriction-modification methylase domain-containing protein [Clostridium]
MGNIYCSYYTKCDYITNYMCKMLDFNEQHKVLEPSAGDGVFIDKLIEQVPNIKIDALDLNQEAVKVLKNKYSNKPNINVIHTDTLFNEDLDKYVKNGGEYDRIIGNPPYGAWLDYDKRADLKEKYSGYYVKETYSLFLLRCISLLKNKGKLSFIIPDTFLFLHRHSSLREYILTNTKIIEVITFPSKVFPNVQFGYSKLSIITLQKENDKNTATNHTLRLITGLKEKEDIDLVREGKANNFNYMELNQQDIYNNPNHAFYMNINEQINEIINNAECRLGDIANCVTGIYVGDNKRFMKVKSLNVRNSKGYEIISEDEIANEYIEEPNLINGLSEKKYIPIVKGSSNSRYLRKEYPWFVNWSAEAVNHYNNDKKARFQNSQFYFKQGIVLPMVKSSMIRATLISNMVFDQSVVGVFPKQEKYTLFLLGLLNSDIVRDIITTINPSANNSANYIKKIPVIIPNEEMFNFIIHKVKTIINCIYNGEDEVAIRSIHNELNSIFSSLYLI